MNVQFEIFGHSLMHSHLCGCCGFLGSLALEGHGEERLHLKGSKVCLAVPLTLIRPTSRIVTQMERTIAVRVVNVS